MFFFTRQEKNRSGSAAEVTAATNSGLTRVGMLRLSNRAWYRHYVLGALLIAYVFSFIDRQILSLMVEPIRRDLGITDFEMSLLQGWAFALFFAVVALPIAYLADRAKRRSIIAGGIALWSIATVSCGFVRSFGAMFVMRMGVGIGEAALSPPAYSLLSDYYPPQRIARALAIFTMGLSLGGGAAYLIGGMIVEAVDNAPDLVLPVVGTLRTWQTVFIIVGMPGLLIALLMYCIKEPERRGELLDHAGETQTVTLTFIAKFLLKRRRLYLGFPVGTALLGVFGYGMMAWYPTFLIRTYGLSIGEAGLWFGLSYLVFGTLGTYYGARFAEYLESRGYRDAHVRYTMLAGIVMTIPATVGPLLPSAPLAILALGPTIFLKCSYYGSSGAVMQLVTPNQMRAQVTALQIFFGSIIGMSIGASMIAVLTDFVFNDDHAIRYSLAVVAAIFCPVGALVLRTCLKPYVEALDEAAKR